MGSCAKCQEVENLLKQRMEELIRRYRALPAVYREEVGHTLTARIIELNYMKEKVKDIIGRGNGGGAERLQETARSR